MAKSRKEPSYLELYRTGALQKRISAARKLLNHCTLCPHKCGTNRLEGELGLCRTGVKARIASFCAHFGEESPLVGQKGSGTIFFEGCNLLCVFCQNYDISNIDKQGDASSDTVNDHELASIMIDLQKQDCHNINLVTPSHVVPQFLAALPIAIEQGLDIPIVYNSSGYDSLDTLHLLDGIVDIYMPDCKFWTPETAALYTNAGDYPEVMQKALKEMHRQVDDLEINEAGLACHGLLVRHLVMPGHLDETAGILKFLARDISTETYVNIMDQYRPCHQAFQFDKINRPLSSKEYQQALALAKEYGLHRLDQREWKNLFRRLGL
jgi:putative pyruvate formate lyase activating enzyme